MRNWSNLPSEVLEIIFKSLVPPTTQSPFLEEKVSYSSDYYFQDVKQVCQCALVCKSWRSPAQRVIFHKVLLDQKEHAKDLAVHLEQSSLGKSIRSLNFYFSFYRLTAPSFLGSFISRCAYLQEVKVFHPNNVYYNTLKSARQNNYLQYLQVIQRPNHSNYIESYVSCALAFQDSLKYIFLGDNTSYSSLSSPSTYEQYRILASQLTQFRYITHLEIRMRTEEKSLFNNLDPVVENCPLLISLSFDIYHTAWPRMENTIGNDNDRLITSAIIPRPNVKHVKVKLSYISCNNFLPYVMHKFPELITLDITAGYVNTLNRENFLIVDENSAINFISYLANIPSRNVKGILYQNMDTILRIIASHYDNLSDDNNSMSRQHPLRVELNLMRPIGIPIDCGEIQSFTSDRRSTSTKEPPPADFCVIYFGKTVISRFLPQLLISHPITNLQLDTHCTSNCTLNLLLSEDVTLKDIIKNGTHLERIALFTAQTSSHRSIILDGWNIDFDIVNRSLTHLIIKEDVLVTERFFTSISESLPNLKHVELYNFEKPYRLKEIRHYDMKHTSFDQLILSSGCAMDSSDRSSDLGLSLDVGNVKSYYICLKEEPNKPIQVQEDDYNAFCDQSNSYNKKLTTISIRCKHLAKLTVNVLHFNFTLNFLLFL